MNNHFATLGLLAPLFPPLYNKQKSTLNEWTQKQNELFDNYAWKAIYSNKGRWGLVPLYFTNKPLKSRKLLSLINSIKLEAKTNKAWNIHLSKLKGELFFPHFQFNQWPQMNKSRKLHYKVFKNLNISNTVRKKKILSISGGGG